MLIPALKVLAAIAVAGLFTYLIGVIVRHLAAKELRRKDRMVMLIPFGNDLEDIEFMVRNTLRLSGSSCDIILVDCMGDKEAGEYCEKLAEAIAAITVVKEEELLDYIKRKL